ncbi:MAG: hypothetical protein RLY61_10 [Candidatus Parcubacteria bacterium]
MIWALKNKCTFNRDRYIISYGCMKQHEKGSGRGFDSRHLHHKSTKTGIPYEKLNSKGISWIRSDRHTSKNNLKGLHIDVLC